MTGIGAIVVRCPRVRDRGAKVPSASALRRRFCLPTCAGRRVWRCWIPILYLKGTSTGDFADALIALLGTPAGSRPRPLDTSRRTGGRSTRAGASAISRPNATSTSGVGAPNNTPSEIIDRLNKGINAALADPKMLVRLSELGVSPIAGSPADFGKLIADETEKWGKVIKYAGIKPE